MLEISDIKMSVDKVLASTKTITTIQIKLPLNEDVYTQTMFTARHHETAKAFDENFCSTQIGSQEKALGTPRAFLHLFGFILVFRMPCTPNGAAMLHYYC